MSVIDPITVQADNVVWFNGERFLLSELRSFVKSRKIKLVDIPLSGISPLVDLAHEWGVIPASLVWEESFSSNPGKKTRKELPLDLLAAHISRVNNLKSLEGAIILVNNTGGPVRILDGMHRIVRCAVDGKTAVPAYPFLQSDVEEFRNCTVPVVENV